MKVKELKELLANVDDDLEIVGDQNGKPATKLSDSKGKTICQDEEYNEYVRKVHNYKSIDDMTVDEIKLMLPAFQDVKLSDIYTPVGA